MLSEMKDKFNTIHIDVHVIVHVSPTDNTKLCYWEQVTKYSSYSTALHINKAWQCFIFLKDRQRWFTVQVQLALHFLWYLGYASVNLDMLSVILLLVKGFNIIICIKETKMYIFPIIFFNVDSSFNIENRLFKFSVGIFDTLMEGTVSEISYLGPSSSFMRLKKWCLKLLENVSRFLT